MIKTVSVLGLLAITLSGCSGMFTNQARCPFQDQGGCQSVSDVNRMVSESKFTNDGRFVQQSGETQSIKKSSVALTRKGDWSGWNSPTPFSGQPLRTAEEDARMWVSPWQDSENSYHGSSYITFVVTPSHWSNTPAKEIKSDDYDDIE
ncbi:conjugal transfer protein TraV (plasmid) [Piscirickettsia salmonis]|uniref:Conjugal transfer protein TraV n=2 Tax=Piscirickettsia salmonis TaxID=1238 RepID=A0AAC8ZQ15_PISSA|nr:type IV conjugative transfer system lipoprotein TraV [Piscirickettsia salmonis]ALB24375.1 conjugal transfer protein TraV [Piscirickettsia salmonis]QGO00511.1 conjugal transfer protein TraV [Piscirickettsia salmonis]QGO14691.1 conjugal transfer protein TraV [Piscirickettsia salmonis]QGO25133.1 conjugal transfer protein TraV [Piscirickettsia salmonis]QGO75405.1 conjugal transfer protein TraV [Piscirickettsia salmonis]